MTDERCAKCGHARSKHDIWLADGPPPLHCCSECVLGEHEFEPGGFYEDDEPVADVQAAFDAGEKLLTGPPTTEACGVVTVEITPDVSGFAEALKGVSAALAPFVIAELRAKLADAEAAIARVREYATHMHDLHAPLEPRGVIAAMATNILAALDGDTPKDGEA